MSKLEWTIINIIAVFLTLFSYGSTNPPATICPKAPKNLQKLRIELYYDGTTDADKHCLSQICPIYQKFGSVLSIDFKIGSYVGYDKDNKLTCSFYPNNDCTAMLQHACASKMVGDFRKFVCCNTGSSKPLETCLGEQNVGLESLNNCVAGKDPKINPAQELLNNSKYLYEKAPEVIRYPASVNNGDFDTCTADKQYTDWKTTVCQMFAEPKPRPCHAST